MPTERAVPHVADPSVLPREAELPQYRPISHWAVATLLVGLAAPLALIGPVLWCVPLAAAPLGWLAFRQLQRTDLKYVGQSATVAGLCLAALFFGWSVTQRLSREIRISSEAEQFATEWLELVLTGKLNEAHQLQIASSRRVELGTDLVSYYEAQSEAGKDLEAFRTNQPLASLAGQADKIKATFAEVTQHQVDGTTDYFTLRYDVISTGPPVPTSLWLSARREQRTDSGGSDWQMTGISATEPAAQ
jgi:hypothetical protein